MSRPQNRIDPDSSIARQLLGRISRGLAVERFRQSLFFLPALFILGTVTLALGTLWIDGQIPSDSLPGALTTTVESSRSILSSIAAGTITAASVVLSLTLVAVQLSSGQHSPRVLRNFIGDRFQQVTIGVVLGTFVYCVLILRAVRAPLEDTGDPIIPNISIIVAIVLGIGALLAVLASVDHTASGLKVESIARQVTDETLRVIDQRFPIRHTEDATTPAPQDPGVAVTRTSPDDGTAYISRAPTAGWIRQMDADALLAAIPPDATLESRVSVGAYVMEGVPLFAVSGVDPLDEDARADLDRRLWQAIDVGNERTMQQDLDFGILRLQDIGLRALSPGINDPGTAVEIIARIGTVLRSLIGRDLVGEKPGPDGRRLTVHTAPDYAAYLRTALDQMRESAGGQVAVYEAMLRALSHLRESAERNDDQAAHEAIIESAHDVLACALDNAPLERDRERLTAIASRGGLAPS